jgi:subtilase family serine protease
MYQFSKPSQNQTKQLASLVKALAEENATLKNAFLSTKTPAPLPSTVIPSTIKPFYSFLTPCASAPTPSANSVAASIPDIPPLYYSGTQLLDLYNIPTGITPASGKRKVIIAIVVAFHYGALLTDLATYWKNAIHFGASATPPTVIVHNLNKTGSTSSAASISSGWGQEECLDVQMICMVCPNAEIHVVEANSDSFTDLGAAVAFALGSPVNADVVSMSWGADDSTSYSSYSAQFTSNRNVCFCASSGDSNTASWPSVLSNCISVGGTTLVWNPTSTAPLAKTEYTWPLAGCGYSRAILTPAYQQTVNTNKYRSIPDISLIANPQTSMYVVYQGKWYGFGGTSVSAPIFSGLLALANQQRINSAKPLLTTIYTPGGTNTYSVQARLYSTVNQPTYSQVFNDITIGQDQGTNSSGAAVTYNAGIKFDVATGLGSPNATGMISLLVGI